ncbi:hypothetical protein [Stenotrophomonas phage BUCTxx99]|nr:hypothetical protein [Stenotrophomonas phage BUCTxx99]
MAWETEMTPSEWAEMPENERYMCVVIQDGPERHFRQVVTKEPLFVLSVMALIHRIASRPEYQAGA